MVQRFRRSLRMLAADKPNVLLACSGGKDSVALAWLLHEMKRLGLLDFSMAHVHHGQHERADEAQESVIQVGEALGAPVHTVRLGQHQIDSHGGVGLEEAMRRERYLSLMTVAQQIGADFIALGHHQGDQSETILLHLIRGSGIKGLAGMDSLERRTIPWWTGDEDAPSIALWRPLLQESPEDVAEIAIASGLPVVEDPTNVDTRYRRNAIRHRVLPLLEEIATGASAAVARSADIIRADAELLNQLAAIAAESCLEGDDLSISVLLGQPVAMQPRVIRHWILNRFPQIEIGASRIAAIAEAARRNRGGSVIEIGNGVTVVVRGGLLVLNS